MTWSFKTKEKQVSRKQHGNRGTESQKSTGETGANTAQEHRAGTIKGYKQWTTHRRTQHFPKF